MNTLSSSATRQEPRGGREGASTPSGPGFPLLLVRTSAYRAGIPVKEVREVLIRRRVTRVPDAEFPLLGLLSLRGDMVTVFDLAGLQAAADRDGATPAASDTTGMTTGAIRPNRVEAVIVLRGGKDSIGLVVDGVEDIRDFTPGADGDGDGEGADAGAPEEPAPADSGPAAGITMAPSPGRLWAGVVQDGRGEIGVLDVDAAVEVATEVSREPLPGEGEEVSLELAENGSAPAGGTGATGAPPPPKEHGHG